MLTIGEFARASRLSPKALRLYDELGLLTPARVNPWTGYRFYQPAQLERARLVAWLRRLGMPLARIRVVCELAPRAAAAEVAAFWQQAEADLASRRDLATFLISHLSGKEAAMTGPALGIRYAAACDIGRCRPVNQDSAYAGERLLAVADGMGDRGEAASAAVIEALKPLDVPPATATQPSPGDLLNALEEAVNQASAAVGRIAGDPRTASTITALLWSGSQLALVHIGDTRAYLLRAGELFQITHDHTLVQSLVDEGKLSPEEAISHPQRALLLQAIDGGQVRPDTSLHDAAAGDRYLLCSDGLSAVLVAGEIHAALAAGDGPQSTIQRLIGLANEAGGPDNIACVVADVVPAPVR